MLWWHHRGLLQRYLRDLLAAEWSALRPGQPALAAEFWTDAMRIDLDLGADSLELMRLATSLSCAIHLHESGMEDHLLARRSFGQWVDTAGEGLARFSGALTFSTSGSTGAAKPCRHGLDMLQQEVVTLARLFGGRRRILVAVPAHHIYGFLFTVLLPTALAMAQDDVVDIRASSPVALVNLVRPGDLVIGFPDYWRSVGQAGVQLPLDVWGVTSPAACPDQVCLALETAGLARLFQIYGSSETAGIGWRDAYHKPYQLMPFWASVGVDSSFLIRRLPQGGQINVQSPDQLQWVTDTLFHVGPRKDFAVQVGGINVFPAQVAARLREHPHVADAAVRLMRADEGQRLKAFIVAADAVRDTQQLTDELNAWMNVHLTPPQRPRALRFGAGLPTTPEGKSADWSIGQD